MVNRLVLLLLGAGYYALCVLRRGFYHGHQRFYAKAQETGLLARTAQAFLTAPPARLVIDYHLSQLSLSLDRLSPMALADYSDDSLAGYGDEHFTKGGEGVHGEQRGLALPLIERAATELPAGAILVEIGAGNGDVCAHLARKFPDLHVIGVDLSTAVADRKHHESNLRFVSGYALDLIEQGELNGDLVFASSTFVVFTPLELARYCRALAARANRIILNEPTWGDYRPTGRVPQLL